MAAERGEAERCGHLPRHKITSQHPAGSGTAQSHDERPRPLPDAAPLKHADHRQHKPSNGDEPIAHECFAQHRNNRERIETRRKAGDDGRQCHDQQRIDAQREARDGNRNARKNQHRPPFPARADMSM